jgi:NADP-dependent 3-hydroxy acid dehydrogenase YdfG
MRQVQPGRPSLVNQAIAPLCMTTVSIDGSRCARLTTPAFPSFAAGMGRFDGRTMIVTGASAGIGAAIARRLGEEGALVHLAARRRDRLEEHATVIRAQGGRAETHACDIADPKSVGDLFAAVASEGTVDAVINTAAILWLEPFATQPEEHWRDILEINLHGAIRVTQHALAHMLPRRSGHVLHVTSTAASLAIPHLAIYSTTKAALAHFLTAMRGEYGRAGVRFTELQIGNTEGTEGGGAIHQNISEESMNSVLRWTGIPSMLEPGDVVDAAVWALSTPPRVRLDRIVIRELAEIPT